MTDLEELRRRPASEDGQRVIRVGNLSVETWTALLSLAARCRELEAENDRLKAILANSNEPCIYCGLARSAWSECRSGFPGCARSDDYSASEIAAARALSQKGTPDAE